MDSDQRGSSETDGFLPLDRISPLRYSMPDRSPGAKLARLCLRRVLAVLAVCLIGAAGISLVTAPVARGFYTCTPYCGGNGETCPTPYSLSFGISATSSYTSAVIQAQLTGSSGFYAAITNVTYGVYPYAPYYAAKNVVVAEATPTSVEITGLSPSTEYAYSVVGYATCTDGSGTHWYRGAASGSFLTQKMPDWAEIVLTDQMTVTEWISDAGPVTCTETFSTTLFVQAVDQESPSGVWSFQSGPYAQHEISTSGGCSDFVANPLFNVIAITAPSGAIIGYTYGWDISFILQSTGGFPGETANVLYTLNFYEYARATGQLTENNQTLDPLQLNDVVDVLLVLVEVVGILGGG